MIITYLIINMYVWYDDLFKNIIVYKIYYNIFFREIRKTFKL